MIKTQEVDSDFDYGLTVENLILAAHGQGLGTCPIGLAKPMNENQNVRNLLSLSEHESIVIGLCLGYPDEQKPIKERNFDVVEWI